MSSSTPHIAASVRGSRGATPNSKLRKICAPASDAASPTINPSHQHTRFAQHHAQDVCHDARRPPYALQFLLCAGLPYTTLRRKARPPP